MFAEKALRRLNRSGLPSSQFWGLLVTLTGLFLLGGSARTDVQSLAVLNPMMILCCGAALLTLKHEHWQDKKYFLVTFGLVFLLVTSYFAPWPQQFENVSQGTTNIASIRATAGVSDAPFQLAVTPASIWATFFFLFGPLAVSLFAIQLNRDDLLRTLPLIILVGCISGVIGLLQILGSANGPLYFYRITNNGSAVGLFANRNHAAVLLASLLPVLAVFAARSYATNRGGKSLRPLIAIIIAVFLIPLILVTGSRTGVLATVVGLSGAVLLYSSQVRALAEAKNGISLKPILAILALLCVGLATIYFSRAQAIERMFIEPNMANVRADYWASGLKLLWQYFPFGSGPGSFAPVFQNEEPLALLNGSYLNRLHNDWLELGLTFGLAGILLGVVGIAYFVRRSFLLWFRMDGTRSAVAIGRMASVIIVVLGIASISDYPLRTPAMMGYAALTLLWFAYASFDSNVVDDRT